MPLRARPLGPGLALVLVLAVPAGAQAGPILPYDVDIEATGSWHVVSEVVKDDSHWRRESDVQVALRGTLHDLAFRDGRVISNGVGAVTVTGSATGKVDSSDHWGEDHERCTGSSTGEQVGEGLITFDLLTPLDGSEGMLVRATDSLSALQFECSGPPLGAEDVTWFDTTPGGGPLDATFTLPPEAIGAGKVIQLVEGPPATAIERCPAQDERTITCEGGWTGQLIFTLRGTDGVTAPGVTDGGVTAPGVTDGGVTAPGVTPPPVTEDDLAPLVLPKRARLDRGARHVSFAVTCPEGCRGTAAVGGTAPRRFTVRPGGRRTVRLRLGAKARRAARRGAPLRLTLRDPAGRVQRAALRYRGRPSA